MKNNRYIEITLNEQQASTPFKKIEFVNGNKRYIMNNNVNNQRKVYNIMKKYNDDIFLNYKDNVYRIYDQRFINELLAKKVTKENRYMGKIIASAVLVASFEIGFFTSTLVSEAKAFPEIITAPTFAYEDVIDDFEKNVIESNDDSQVVDIQEQIEEMPSVTEEINEFVPEENNNFVYSFNSAVNNGSDKINYSKTNYQEYAQNYAYVYGLDANLLLSMISQENAYNTRNDSNIGGRGIMQIESIWWGENIRAFNFVINEYETVTIDGNKLNDPDYSLKIGAMILRNYYDTLYSKYVPNVLSPSECINASLLAYNMGITSATNLIDNYGKDFLNYRNTISWGDQLYNEHVLSFLNDGSQITFRTKSSEESMVIDNLNDDTYTK